MKLRDILIKVAEADERDLYTLLKIIGRKRRREFLHTLKRCIEGYEPFIERLPVPVKDKIKSKFQTIIEYYGRSH